MKKSKNKSDSKKAEKGIPPVSDAKKRELIPRMIMGTIAVLIGCLFYSCSQKKPASSKAETYHIEGSAAPLKAKEDGAKEENSPVALQQNPTSSDPTAAKKALVARLEAPLLVFGQKGEANYEGMNDPKKTTSTDPNTHFLNQVADAASIPTSEARRLNHRDTLITQGTLIHAVLESAIDSDLPGYLRAVVSEPVYAEDGTQVLISSGSRLMGQYKSQMQNGQSRIFIVWSRVMTPEGFSVMLGSPGVDTLGVAGLAADQVDRHFWQMFGTASLLSVLGAGVSNTGVGSQDTYNASQAYREAVAESFAQSARHTLQQDTRIAPTLHVHQGTPIHVFVIRDIQFDQALQSPIKKINVF